MSASRLPLSYQLEIFEESFVNDPTASFESDTPFMAFHAGDFIDPRSMMMTDLDVPAGHWWKVTAVMHRIEETEGAHLSHQVNVCVMATLNLE